MDVFWSGNAQVNYLEVIEQIFEKWNLDIVLRFENQVKELIEKISQYNYICPSSKIVNLHRCIINEHTSLIYKLDGNIINVIDIIFNQSNHKF
ncbi:hypothetical protein Q766_09560 [Flavobacterium subsaxonicum WB 4.1-42 = DSM 21790]|uniref:Type II toxin-antitoxin system RelE/ParE family toxin n=1 Tax=Flavobacterium subsaxonicum WB 4.1-42 = DSM 21790 TaxID=1121898 RepID=A0A0A2MKP0_9FLAO|nr:hypothetical protein Q766_09560 [Flavobacterium subsaxonicum WB 4.1-42 = DSM 21790]